ncbi:MAG: hypothetical protein INQ03_14325 [Candidatus Heimdallarchaeota archaeon]|nr:hypothetical protein [Candidatus Heimdallarchaeota archaeon]
MSLLLQDLVHCEKHCMALADPDNWVCGLKKHTDVCTQGCYYGSTGFNEDFEIEEEDFFKLPDPDDFEKDEYCYTIEEIQEQLSSIAVEFEDEEEEEEEDLED